MYLQFRELSIVNVIAVLAKNCYYWYFVLAVNHFKGYQPLSKQKYLITPNGS